jgi:hypothetical protein
MLAAGGSIPSIFGQFDGAAQKRRGFTADHHGVLLKATPEIPASWRKLAAVQLPPTETL